MSMLDTNNWQVCSPWPMCVSSAEVDRSAIKRNITFLELIRTTFILHKDPFHQVPGIPLVKNSLHMYLNSREFIRIYKYMKSRDAITSSMYTFGVINHLQYIWQGEECVKVICLIAIKHNFLSFYYFSYYIMHKMIYKRWYKMETYTYERLIGGTTWCNQLDSLPRLSYIYIYIWLYSFARCLVCINSFLINIECIEKK